MTPEPAYSESGPLPPFQWPPKCCICGTTLSSNPDKLGVCIFTGSHRCGNPECMKTAEKYWEMQKQILDVAEAQKIAQLNALKRKLLPYA
jgi:hypothetical protein